MNQCPRCGHPNHKSRMHHDICTFYVPAMGAECGCDYPKGEQRQQSVGTRRDTRMPLNRLSPPTRDGLQKWALDVHKDERLFDNIACPWAWIWFQLRESEDRPDWFPGGKWWTLQRIEEVISQEARRIVVARGAAA